MIDGRTRRSRAVRSAFTTGFATKAASAVLALITISIAVRSMPQDAWGLIATLTGLISLFGFLDFGIGNSLISALAAAHAKNKQDAASELVSNALVFLSGIAVLLALITVAVATYAPRNWLLLGNGVDESAARLALLAFGLSVAMAAPASLGSRIALGMQEGRQNNIVSFAATACTFLGVAAASALHAPVLAFLALLLFIPVAANLMQSVHYLTNGHIRLSRRAISRQRLTAQVPQGLPFTLLVLAGAVSYQTDLLVVSYVAGLSAAASYGIASRLFGTINGLLGGGLQQMWASTAHAIADDDMDWVRGTFRRVLLLTGGAYLLASLCIVGFGGLIVQIWLDDKITVSTTLLLMFAAWSSYAFVMSQLSTLLNGAGRIWPQVVAALLMATANLPLSVLLTHTLGEIGPLVGSSIAHVLFVGIPTVVLVRRVLRVQPQAAAL